MLRNNPGDHPTRAATTRRPANAGRRYPAEILTPAEVEALLGACSTRAATGMRNRALILTLHRGGLRISEALKLTAADIDTGTGTVTVTPTDRDRRTITLDAEAVAVLDRWLRRRAQRDLEGTGPAFCTLQGEPLQPAYVRALLPRLARKAGIAKRVHAHGLRDAFAAELLVRQVPLESLRLQLGHSTRATTYRYLRRLAPACAGDPSALPGQPTRRGTGRRRRSLRAA